MQGAGLYYLSGMKRSPEWERCSVLFACATGLYHRKELWHVNIVISDNVGGRMEPGVKMPSGVVQTQGRAGQGRRIFLMSTISFALHRWFDPPIDVDGERVK